MAKTSPVASPELRADPRRIEADIMALASFTRPDLPYTRLAFSQEDKQARQWLIDRMKEMGLSVRVDAAANITGRRQGQDSSLPVIMTGSHIDTVRGGGRFDGIAGVVSALELVRLLNGAGLTLRHPLEVVCFTCEEASVQGLTPFGSRAMASQLDMAAVKSAVGPDGGPLPELLADLGGDATRLAEARLDPKGVLAQLELHIEQGKELERQGIPLGVVTAIAAPWRGRAVITGVADHAGATPMTERYDALCAASDLILAVERVARSYRDMVGTVGSLTLQPNMVNVIPGRVEMSLEVRSTVKAHLQAAVEILRHESLGIARRRGVSIDLRWGQSEEPVAIREEMLVLLEESCHDLGARHTRIVSRASHDSARLSAVIPVGMLFVPSRGGLSHCHEEWTDYEQIALGASVLARAVLKLDGR